MWNGKKGEDIDTRLWFIRSGKENQNLSSKSPGDAPTAGQGLTGSCGDTQTHEPPWPPGIQVYFSLRQAQGMSRGVFFTMELLRQEHGF